MDTTNLQPRLAELYALLVDGKNEKSICKKLKISKSGYGNLINELFNKTGFACRNDLLAYALLNGTAERKVYYAKMTNTQLKIVECVRNGMTRSDDIATLAFRHVTSITAAKTRLYKKLSLSGMRELIFLLAEKECEV